uniref:Uncharacterized protein n=1 Tax=Quercus lobata TaxID=97700 RepID=A0A7N2MGA8_QUELO
MGVRDAIGDVKDELISMQSFLVDADKKGTINEGEKTWVANVRDLANEVEDVIDQFMYHIISQQTGGRSARQLIMGWFMDGEPHQTVISIVGMGGSGKTTLVANTYNNDDVKKHFDYFAWITVSKAYELEDLLRSLITEFYESRKQANLVDLSSMNYRLLVKTLVNYLEKKCIYLS